MKASFIVTIEGAWMRNGKPITAAQIERDIRAAMRKEFEYLASNIRVRSAEAATGTGKRPAGDGGGDHA